MLRLRVHLRPYERKALVNLWSDTKIQTGQRWREEIATALNKAAVAVLLVSADFLASDFITENELPPLLKAASEEGVRILPVILKPCAFMHIDELSPFQAVNDPLSPLAAMQEAESEAVWVEVAEEVRNAVEGFANALGSDSDNSSLFDEFLYAQGLLGEELLEPSRISNFHVYEYSHIDILEFMPRASVLLQSEEKGTEAMDCVRELFRRHGWEGDGELRIMWLPPFIGAGTEDTWGLGVWFVKQNNNGTAFIASPVSLPFSRLLEQQ